MGATRRHGGAQSRPARAPAAVDRRQRRYAYPGKRAFDLAVSIALLVLSVPVLAVVALAVRLSSPGPVIFRQRRVGYRGRPFEILKFRTMHCDAEDRLGTDGALRDLYLRGDHKIDAGCDPRITAIGRVLRRLSLDELPQLLNVVRGDMSLVGPRPVRPGELACYADADRAYLGLQPGLTGLWQVSGRSEVKFPERAEMDLRYARTCGPMVDLRILLSTPATVLGGRGAH